MCDKALAYPFASDFLKEGLSLAPSGQKPSMKHLFGPIARLVRWPDMLASVSLSDSMKAAIRHQVAGIFNDPVQGQAPVTRSANALLPETSVAWRVHGDIASMVVGGIEGLLLQMLHPSVLAGVWDHSNFRTDMHGRFRRTARFIATTTYADRSLAEAMIEQVRRVHDQVSGQLPDGGPYHANNPDLLAWVHVTETSSFLDAWIRYGEPMMTKTDQDRYFAEMAMIGDMIGASPVPRTRSAARSLIERTRPQLRADARTFEVAHLILQGGAMSPLARMPRRLTTQAAVDLLPRWARRLHGFTISPWEKPVVRTGTLGVAQTLRWAFR